MIEHYKQCFKHKLNHEGLCPKCERELNMDGFKTMAEVMANGNPVLHMNVPNILTIEQIDRLIQELNGLKDALLSAKATQK